MKYLKKFNENLQDDVDTVMDICIDLQDQGFIVTPPHEGGFPSKSIIIQKKNTVGMTVFRYKEVEETVDRIKEFLGDKLSSIYFNKGKGWFNGKYIDMKIGYTRAIKITWGK